MGTKRKTGRAKPMTNKISVSKSGKRRYGCGGKVSKKKC